MRPALLLFALTLTGCDVDPDEATAAVVAGLGFVVWVLGQRHR